MSDAQHPVPDRFFYNIGLIAAKWAAIEADIEFTLLAMLNVRPETGLIITSRLATRAKTDLIRLVLNHEAMLSPPRNDAAFAILNRIEAAYIKRNEAVHQVWSGTSDPLVANRATIQAKQKLKYGRTPVHIEHLEQVADELTAIGHDLRTLSMKYDAAAQNNAENPY